MRTLLLSERDDQRCPAYEVLHVWDSQSQAARDLDCLDAPQPSTMAQGFAWMAYAEAVERAEATMGEEERRIALHGWPEPVGTHAGSAVLDVRSDRGSGAADIAEAAFRQVACRPEFSWPCDLITAVVFGPTPVCANGESGGDALAVSPGGHRGWYQLAGVHVARFEAHGWTWDDAFDPERSTVVAHEIWLDSGWGPWSCARW